MPSLDAEPACFPDDLFDRPTDNEPPWIVVRTRANTEKALARVLYREKIPFFLPLHTTRRRVQRRLVESHLPLFSGYLFVRGEGELLTPMYRTNYVASVLEVPEREQEKLHGQLDRFHGLLGSGEAVTPEEQLPAGAEVEIVSGPLAGYKGQVLRDGEKLKVVVTIDFIQQGASVEVDPAFVRAEYGARPPADRRADRGANSKM